VASIAIAWISRLERVGGADLIGGAETKQTLEKGTTTMIRAVKFVSVPVTDQDRALAFYTGKLGFAIATDQPMGPDARWIELRIPGAETKLVLWKDEEKSGGFRNMAFYADDVEKTYNELAARGVEFSQPYKVEPWGASAIFKDPDGNEFVIGTK
jgi:predicted enzyme related to lactoylglutathione lyase